MKYTPEEIDADLKRYCDGMMDNGISICSAIEQRYNLYGYPPSVVTQVLAAGARGEDMVRAEDIAIGNDPD